MVITRIQTDPIELSMITEINGESGAELQFCGIVRERENGRRIEHLIYSHYEGMAETQLQDIAEKVLENYHLNRIEIIHRVGNIKVNETSLLLRIQSTHRKEALEAMDWVINELKKELPIWKQAVFTDGTVEHVECGH